MKYLRWIYSTPTSQFSPYFTILLLPSDEGLLRNWNSFYKHARYSKPEVPQWPIARINDGHVYPSIHQLPPHSTEFNDFQPRKKTSDVFRHPQSSIMKVIDEVNYSARKKKKD